MFVERVPFRLRWKPIVTDNSADWLSQLKSMEIIRRLVTAAGR